MSIKQEIFEPKLLSKSIHSEPVETGCCLRSCGGSPKVMQENVLKNHATKKKLEQIN